MKTVSISERFLSPTVSSQLFLIIVTIIVFFFIQPIAKEVAKACCFKKPRRGQRLKNGVVLPYSIQTLKLAEEGSSYNMINVKKYRRALLLLN
jgi:hypothetical protein